MKRLRITSLALALALLSSGCTSTQLIEGNFKRISFLQRVELGEVKVGTDGTITVKGYRNDGGNEAMAAAVAAGVAAGLKAVKP